MDDVLLALVLLAGPVALFRVWHATEDRRRARRRMVAVIAIMAILGVLDAREEPAYAWLGSAVLFASPCVLPAIALSFLGRERSPLPEALACLLLAAVSTVVGLGVVFGLDLMPH